MAGLIDQPTIEGTYEDLGATEILSFKDKIKRGFNNVKQDIKDRWHMHQELQSIQTLNNYKEQRAQNARSKLQQEHNIEAHYAKVGNAASSFMTQEERDVFDQSYRDSLKDGDWYDFASKDGRAYTALSDAAQTRSLYNQTLQKNADRAKQIEEGYVPGLNAQRNKAGNASATSIQTEKKWTQATIGTPEKRDAYIQAIDAEKTAKNEINKLKSIESYGYKNNKTIVDEAKKDYAEKVKNASSAIDGLKSDYETAQNMHKEDIENGGPGDKNLIDEQEKAYKRADFYNRNKSLLATKGENGEFHGAEVEYKQARAEAQKEYRQKIAELKARDPSISQEKINEQLGSRRASVQSATLKKMQERMGGATEQEASEMINNIRRAQLNRTQQGIIDTRLAENKRLQTEEGKAEFVASHRGENGEFVKKARTSSPASKMVEKPGGWGKGKMVLAAGVGAAVIGGLASLGTARMMMAGGAQPNSNLYNPYQSSY